MGAGRGPLSTLLCPRQTLVCPATCAASCVEGTRPVPIPTPPRVPRWLCNDQIDPGTRRWAVEGLAYLTFDADVKEEFVEDEAALKALFQLSRVAPWVPLVVWDQNLGFEVTRLPWQVSGAGAGVPGVPGARGAALWPGPPGLHEQRRTGQCLWSSSGGRGCEIPESGGRLGLGASPIHPGAPVVQPRVDLEARAAYVPCCSAPGWRPDRPCPARSPRRGRCSLRWPRRW